MLAALLPLLTGIFGQISKSLFPDPADALKAQELQQQLQLALMQQASALEAAAADIVKTEAASEHWLAACWRPIVMLTFASLIVARWFGLTAPGITEAVELQLWEIVKIGLGGYTLARSAEKIVPQVAAVMKR
jgi:hypothetical protein